MKQQCREALLLVGIDAPFLEMTSMADIPAGTGLGSSGNFTIALLKALHTLKKNLVHPAELTEQACEIEINRSLTTLQCVLRSDCHLSRSRPSGMHI
jgi:galactokinase/mevalonate kinase-like predicted kinase